MRCAGLILYQNRKTRDYSVERYAGIYAVGNLIQLSAAEMARDGVGLILRYLSEELPQGGVERAPAFSREEERAFHRRHRGVYVSVAPDGRINLGPLRRKGSGHVVDKDEVVHLPLSSTNDEFMDALNLALEAAD